MAIPKSHRANEVPQIYRLASASGGVFINPALTEPFGLTLLEAAASGLPLVATENGGPVDIIANCDNGDTGRPAGQGAPSPTALLQLLRDREAWEQASRNGIEGVRQHYSWQAHADATWTRSATCPTETSPSPASSPRHAPSHYRDRAIFTDLDQNLIGNPAALQRFVEVMRENRKCVTLRDRHRAPHRQRTGTAEETRHPHAGCTDHQPGHPHPLWPGR